VYADLTDYGTGWAGVLEAGAVEIRVPSTSEGEGA
jgi:hypothetical protein